MPASLRYIFLSFFLLFTISSRADIIGMLKPVVVYDKKANGKTIEMKVEFELWNYFHSGVGHRWTEVYHFNPEGILLLSYGDGNWASPDKQYWKHRYKPISPKLLFASYYEYPDSTSHYAETKKYLQYADTVEVDYEFNQVTLEKISQYIQRHSEAFASRHTMVTGGGKKVVKAVENIAKDYLDKLNKKEEPPKPATSYMGIYIALAAVVLAVLVFVLFRKKNS